MRFSIVVPVYNVEKYIEKCLNSIAEQDFDDYEVIIIDDESKDQSISLAEKYILDKENYRIIHQQNKGLGGARNTGAEKAKGDYILFLDSDDYLEKDALRKLNNVIKTDSDTDIIAFNVNETDENGRVLRKIRSFSSYVNNVQKNLFVSSPSAWNKVFKRSFYEGSGFVFPEHRLYEDTSMIRKLIVNTNKIHLLDEYLYNYVQRDGSITHNGISERYKDILIEIKDLEEYLKKKSLYDEYSEEFECVAIRSLILFQAANINRQDTKNSMQNEFISYINDRYPECYKNTYLSRSEKIYTYLLSRYKYRMFHILDGIIRRNK